MKEISKLIIVIVILSVFSCKKDDSPKNYFKINGEKYEISEGRLVFYSFADTSYEIKSMVGIEFISDGLSFVEGEDYLSGQGNTIGFAIISGDKSSLDDGIYSYHEFDMHDSTTWVPDTFFDANYFLNYSIDYPVDNYTRRNINEGEIDLKYNSNSITLKYAGQDTEGNTIICSYSGSVSTEFIELNKDGL